MFCDLYACIKLFISNNLRIYDVRRYYRFESRTHRNNTLKPLKVIDFQGLFS